MEFALRVGPAIGSLGQPSSLFSPSSSPYTLFSGFSLLLHHPVLSSSTGVDVAEPVLKAMQIFCLSALVLIIQLLMVDSHVLFISASL